MRIFVLGSGGWGTALALMLTGLGNSVTLWSPFREEADALKETRENRVLKGVRLPEALRITDSLDDLPDSGMAVFATPSFAVRETAARLRRLLSPGAVIVSVSKGIERDTGLRFSEVIEEETGGGFPVVALSGPSHAEEVGRGIPTGCVAASKSKRAAELVQDTFMNSAFRVYSTPDIVGVELGGALKNVIALAVGISDGSGFGDNTKAMLMTRGLTEMARLGGRMGGHSETFAGLAGVGDLIVTCTSMHSRNRRAGLLIGSGTPAKRALGEVGGVVEGYYAAEAEISLAEKLGVEVPIARETYNVLFRDKNPHDAMVDLMSRGKRHELEDVWMKKIVWDE